MKYQRLTAIACGTILAALLPLGVSAEAPTVRFNGMTVDVRTAAVGNQTYFSLRDYWRQIARAGASGIFWDNEKKIVHNGQEFLNLNAQTYQNAGRESVPLSDPAVLLDGTVYVAPSFLTDSATGGRTTLISTAGELDFYQTLLLYETGGSDYALLSPVRVSAETGLPLLAEASFPTGYQFSPEAYDCTQGTDEQGRTVFTYTRKDDPTKGMTATVQDGFVTLLQDHGEIFAK